jgi:uncharacterized membrane protein YedE/YeeE
MNSVTGGVLIGISVSLMLLFNGRVTGISGILGGVLNHSVSDKMWRMMFIFGLLLGGIALRFLYPHAFGILTNNSILDFIIAGFLVGFGTSLGNGCTSGHGVCGISRFSIRSISSTFIFILTGVMSVLIFKLFRGEL